MSTTYIATAPDGSEHKRTTRNRFYSHAILVRDSYDYALACASVISSADKSNYDFSVAMANGTHPLSVCEAWNNPETHAAGIERHRKWAASAPNRDAYAIMKRDDRVAIVEAHKAAGRYETWSARTWCGRADLAAKELARAKADPYFAEAMAVRAVAVATKGRGPR